MKNKNDISTKTEADLNAQVLDMRQKLQSIRFGAAGSRTRNTSESRTARKDIARAKTELNARQKTAMVAKSEKTA
ncbi:MAG: Ribosomal protein [Candidatus Kaiserbacteria bacterium]|nr:Ribosomal protein [Candidatus Kaiserbacteria bacterium]